MTENANAPADCMNKREYMAVTLCAGMCANGDISAAMSNEGMKPNEIRASLSESAIKLADELLNDLALTSK